MLRVLLVWQDLVQLLRNVESEMRKCEESLREEVEKMEKYRVDDIRRTHNYDEYITTYLLMLAEQGSLADLVEDKRPGNVFSKTNKKTKAVKKTLKRK